MALGFSAPNSEFLENSAVENQKSSGDRLEAIHWKGSSYGWVMATWES